MVQFLYCITQEQNWCQCKICIRCILHWIQWNGHFSDL